MNKDIILELVATQVKNNQLTYETFERIFSILSRKEQYEVVNILSENGIELVDAEEDEDETLIIDLDEPLYDETIFNDDITNDTFIDSATTHIYQSNTNLCILIQKGKCDK